MLSKDAKDAGFGDPGVPVHAMNVSNSRIQIRVLECVWVRDQIVRDLGDELVKIFEISVNSFFMDLIAV